MPISSWPDKSGIIYHSKSASELKSRAVFNSPVSLCPKVDRLWIEISDNRFFDYMLLLNR